MAVTEDYMLLGVGVIAVASFIHCFRKWKTVKCHLMHPQSVYIISYNVVYEL